LLSDFLDIKGDLSVAKHPTDATSYATRGGILSDSYLSTFKDAEEHPKDAPRVSGNKVATALAPAGAR